MAARSKGDFQYLPETVDNPNVLYIACGKRAVRKRNQNETETILIPYAPYANKQTQNINLNHWGSNQLNFIVKIKQTIEVRWV